MVKVMQVHDRRQQRLTPEEKAEKLIKETEAAKAHIFTTPGKDKHNAQPEVNKQFHSVIVDEDYLLVASHVDNITLTKIVGGDYVDFAKLLPHDKILQEEDQRLEMVVRGGKTFWVPASETQSVSSFSKWEQAFRVY